jgi:hypothetical protein
MQKPQKHKLVYKAYSEPHFAIGALAHNNALSGFFRDFRGFMGLRFICLSYVVPIAEKGDGKMKCVSVMEEKAENAVKVIKAVVFQLRPSETAERTRAD